MKINLKIKSVQYAKYVAEFLYKLHPVVLKEELYMKKNFGELFGFIDLGNMNYNQREQLANLTSDKEEMMLSSDEVSEEIEEEMMLSSDEVSEERKYHNYLNDISKSERKDFIDLDFYIEVEDRQYGRMLAEFFDSLTEGCLEQAVLCKREQDEVAKLIGRYLETGDIKTEEECKILREKKINTTIFYLFLNRKLRVCP